MRQDLHVLHKQSVWLRDVDAHINSRTSELTIKTCSGLLKSLSAGSASVDNAIKCSQEVKEAYQTLHNMLTSAIHYDERAKALLDAKAKSARLEECEMLIKESDASPVSVIRMESLEVLRSVVKDVKKWCAQVMHAIWFKFPLYVFRFRLKKKFTYVQ